MALLAVEILVGPKEREIVRTLAIESLLEGQAEALTQTDISKALEGDSIAFKPCMDRIAPTPKDNTVQFSLLPITTANNASETVGSVLSAVSNGDLTPLETTRIVGIIDSYRRTLELTDIENRLKALANDFATA